MKQVRRKLRKIINFGYWKGLAGIFSLFPIKKQQVFFESFLGRSYSDSPKALHQYMLEQKLDYKYIWSLKEPFAIAGTITVTKTRIRYLYYLKTSKYIINNSRMPLYFKKRKNQIIIQTWHGTPLKKLVADMEEVHLPGVKSKETYVTNFNRDVHKWDYLVVPNQYSLEKFNSAFDFNGQFLKSGYPRNDSLKNFASKLNAEEKLEVVKEIKEKLGISINKKVILYAPTFRDDEFIGKGQYIQRITFDIKRIKQENPDTVVLFRNHYLVTKVDFDYPTLAENYIDVSKYGELDNLYLIADVLITDYSSVFFDFSLLQKPIILYQYDYERYKNTLRDFYLQKEQFPVNPIYTEEELYKEIKLKLKAENKNNYLEKYQNLNIEEYQVESSKYITDKIFK